MSTLSGCTLVRNAVKLRYPLEASILTYYPLCAEVIVAYDPKSEDETEAYVLDLARRYPRVRAVPSPWDMKNHVDGTEITIQSNVGVEACTSEWILYVQADEAIHEGDHREIAQMLGRKDVNGLLFARRSYMGTLNQEIPDYYARNLLRLFRNGQGCVVGDGMTCGFFQNVAPSIWPRQMRMYNYSRMGDREEILLRSRYRDNFHHNTAAAIEANQKKEFQQRVAPCDPETHPEAIRQVYSSLPLSAPAPAAPTHPITLACLLGNGERNNIIPFLWQFRNWPGEILLLDDETQDGAPTLGGHFIRHVLGMEDSRFRIIRRKLNDDFASARNALQEAARSPWVLACDLDERWDPNLLKNILMLTAQLDRDGKTVCGFPRANFVDGTLVNDVSDAEWTEAGLTAALERTSWPPRNPDVKFRLLRKEERWEGRIHETVAGSAEHSDRAVVLRDFWILHDKSLDRQRRQDAFYRSLGQVRGMPQPPPEASLNLRERTLAEVLNRVPPGPVVVVETGTLRDGSPEARHGDGWSTLCLAELLARRGVQSSRLYSIDIDPKCIEVAKRTISKELHRWVTWICGDSRSALKELDVPGIDVLYLDSSDDPMLILSEFEAALPKLRKTGVVVVDDVGSYHAGPEGKGTLVIPEARRLGWKVELPGDERSRMAILTPPV